MSTRRTVFLKKVIDMSNKYNSCSEIPSDVLCERLEQLATAVTMGGDAISREFIMRIPAERDRDADFVIREALKRVKQLDELQHEIHCLRCLEDSYGTQDEVVSRIFLKLNDLCDG